MTRLQFEAILGGVQVKAPKAAEYFGEAKTGELHLTLTVRQPAPPRKPVKPYSLEKEPPSLPKRKRGETDAEYEERTARARADIAHRAEIEERYAADLEQWRQAVLGARDRTMAYAQLVGVAAAFGAKPVTVTIEPADQDLLPGFEASLLAPPIDFDRDFVGEDDEHGPLEALGVDDGLRSDEAEPIDDDEAFS